jgi:hypothetical protein
MDFRKGEILEISMDNSDGIYMLLVIDPDGVDGPEVAEIEGFYGDSWSGTSFNQTSLFELDIEQWNIVSHGVSLPILGEFLIARGI